MRAAVYFIFNLGLGHVAIKAGGSSNFSKRVFEKLGFEKLSEIVYSEFKIDGKVVIKNTGEHKSEIRYGMSRNWVPYLLLEALVEICASLVRLVETYGRDVTVILITQLARYSGLFSRYLMSFDSFKLNNLIFFMFIHFPAILLVKTIDSYLHEFVDCVHFV